MPHTATKRRRTRRRAAQKQTPSIIVVANRLPVSRVGSGAGARWESSAGGLVTAMAPVLQKLPGVWVGWPGGEARLRPSSTTACASARCP